MTIAGIVGDNLDSYLEQKIHQIDLLYRNAGMPEDRVRENGLIERTNFFLEENDGLYNWGAVTAPDGTVTRYAPGQSTMVTKLGRGQAGLSEANAGTEHPAWISDKQISPLTGWYEMHIRKEIDTEDGVYQLCFAMNLEALYKDSVAKVKIGKNGYSVVKDQNMYIIMHHAKDQIGLDAIYDRERLYPERDYSSMYAWLTRQEEEESGVGVIDSYDWADEEHPKVQRVAAFKAIYIQGGADYEWYLNNGMIDRFILTSDFEKEFPTL